MSHVYLPHEPKAKLTDILKRRDQTLDSWMLETGMLTPNSVKAYCLDKDIQAPSHKELADAAPRVQEIAELLPIVTPHTKKDEEQKPPRRPRNALKKVSTTGQG